MTKPALHTQFEGIAGLRAALAQRQVSAVDLAQSALAAAGRQRPEQLYILTPN